MEGRSNKETLVARLLTICTFLLCACGSGVEGNYATNDEETRARDMENLKKRLPPQQFQRAAQESRNWLPGGIEATIQSDGGAQFTIRDERRKTDKEGKSRTLKGEWRIEGGTLLVTTPEQDKPLDCAITGKDLACAFTSRPDQRVILYRQ